MRYEDLSPALRAIVDRRATELVAKWGMPLDVARQWVIASLAKRTVRRSHGTGH